MTGRHPLNTSEPWHYDLLALLRWAERENAGRPRVGHAARRSGDVVTLAQDPFFAFPASNVVRAAEDEDGRLAVAVQFLGLLGPQGAMPLSVTDEAYHWTLNDDDAFARFLDIFNNRFIQLFFRAWADARPITHRDRPQDDRFLRYVGAPVGLGLSGDKPPADGSVSGLAKAAYAGLLAARVKSASRLRSFLGGLFHVDVEVEEFVPTALTLAPDDQSRLGGANSGLGVDIMLGSTVLTFDEKVRIRVIVTSLEEYESFLPSGPNAERLADAINFYLGDELDWDVELALPTALAPPTTLGKSGRLGWTGWMTPQHPSQTEALLADARFRPPTPGATVQHPA
ncbi:MAG: type VI secretion system baseplate subunit TssG [Pseudomonadota bacterium]